MALIDTLQNIFKRKPAPTEAGDSQLSLAMPDMSVQPEGMETVQGESGAAPSAAPLSMPSSMPSSVISPEGPPSVGASAARQGAADSVLDDGLIAVPGLGRKSPAALQSALLAVLVLSLLVLGYLGWSAAQGGGNQDAQRATGSRALAQVPRLARAAQEAAQGDAAGFTDLADSLAQLTQAVRGLREGSGNASPAADWLAGLDELTPLLDRTEKAAQGLLQQRAPAAQGATAVQQWQTQSAQWLAALERAEAARLPQRPTVAEVQALGQLKLLTQQMARTASLVRGSEAAAQAEALARELGQWEALLQGLLNGSAERGLAPWTDPASRQLLEPLVQTLDTSRAAVTQLRAAAPALQAMAQARSTIAADSEPLRRGLEALLGRLQVDTRMDSTRLGAMVLAALLALLSAAGLSRVQLADVRKRQLLADAQARAAERQEHEAKRVNDATQAAILRLMNELQLVAEGDLTQQATVTEDITGAIADSINYTVEELRALVGSVQTTAAKVAQTTSDVDANSTELLVASKEQLHEIQETGQAVLQMAGRINEVSQHADESARVARQALHSAETGLRAVQNAIGGMNTIRDQIQDTSKRIKRLGESSQEIGEITELISDITEQTNVLALNAAIQAASAGESGRGFSVVAEEVQRLAERSADATRQIAALVKGIQTDTQDAIGAMERSTQGVVEGARLSDDAGAALIEIDRITRRVAELIEQIASTASREAGQANVVAENIQHIFAVTEQTSEGTQVTAAQVRELSRMAEDLRQSVSRFTIR